MSNATGNDGQGLVKEQCGVLDQGRIIRLCNVNPTTRRYPRTLEEAFPFDDRDWVEEQPESIHIWDVCVIAASLMLWVFAVYCWSVS
jgi:hypothetical protein